MKKKIEFWLMGKWARPVIVNSGTILRNFPFLVRYEPFHTWTHIIIPAYAFHTASTDEMAARLYNYGKERARHA